MPEFPYCEFEDLFATPLRNGVSYPSETRGLGIPMVNLGEAFAYDYVEDQPCERVPLTEAEYQRFLLEAGDLLFVRQSLKFEGAGRCVIVKSSKEPHTWESHLIRVRLNPKIASSLFYYYFFRSPQGRTTVATIIEQVAAAGIRGSDLRRLAVPKPTIQVQLAIARLLETLDDKIAVNEQIATTMNQLLKAYFADLMKGANRAVQLGDIVDFNYGKALKTEKRTAGSVPVFGGNGISGWHDTPLVNGPGVIVGRKGANAGSVAWSQRDFWPIDTSFFIRARTGLPMEFVYFLLEGIDLRRLVGDSAIPGLNRDIALRCEVALPDTEAIQNFTLLAQTMLESVDKKTGENRALAELRDTLLPKLISGELRIRDAERQVGDVV